MSNSMKIKIELDLEVEVSGWRRRGARLMMVVV